MTRLPTGGLNLGMDEPSRVQDHGAEGPVTRATNIGAGGNHVPQRTASGGATAGLRANPSRTGNPSPEGYGPEPGAERAPRRLPGDARSKSLFAPCALWRAKSRSNGAAA